MHCENSSDEMDFMRRVRETFRETFEDFLATNQEFDRVHPIKRILLNCSARWYIYAAAAATTIK